MTRKRYPGNKPSTTELRAGALARLETFSRVSIPDAAAIFGLHRYTIRDYINNGTLSAFRIGRRDYILKEEIDRFLPIAREMTQERKRLKTAAVEMES